MRWNFGGNLHPVRMICEYDWKECPIALFSYIWSEIVTDVAESITGEGYLWRILAVMLFCWMVYCKIGWFKKGENAFARDSLIKVGFKVRDLELKINILTYKMQYGTWPLPHEIPTPSLNDLRNVKITLSNTSRQNMWTKHHLHGYITKCVKNSEENKSIHKLLSINGNTDLDNKNFLSRFGTRNDNDSETLRSERNLKLLHNENNNGKNYEKLLKTTAECRRYMDEINESNKSLGLFENSTDISDDTSAKEISAETESEANGRRFLIDQKKWQEIYKHKNSADQDSSETEFTKTNQLFSASNLEHKNSAFCASGERYPLKSCENRSKLLPPGLSITFLSDKFETYGSSDKCVTEEGATDRNKSKTSTNETLNKVKEKLESLHDIKDVVKNSKLLNNVNRNLENKKSSEITSSIKTIGKKSAVNRDNKYERKGQSNVKKVEKLSSKDCDTSSGDNGASFDIKPVKTSGDKVPARRSNSHNGYKTMIKTTNNSFGNIAKAQSVMDSDVHTEFAAPTKINDVKIGVQNPSNVPDEINQNSIKLETKEPSLGNGIVKSLSKITREKENLSTESDSSASCEIKSSSDRKKDLNCRESEQKFCEQNENMIKNTDDIFDDIKRKENNINLNSKNENQEESISRKNMSMRYVFSPHDKSARQIEMETDDDAALISQASSQTELSKDSSETETDKSTTALLREALEFKKALLTQINKENEICDEKTIRNESSECDSDDTSRFKPDNNFRSKLLDIISEEQSAGSSTERTSRTYILSRAINETNFYLKDNEKYLNGNDNTQVLKSNFKVKVEDDNCGDSKSIVTASSSEYFSIINTTDNDERISEQKINQFTADEDEIKEPPEINVREILEGEVESTFLKNHENNNITQGIYEQIEKSDLEDEIEFFESIPNATREEKSQDFGETKTIIIPEGNFTHPMEESIETCVENSKTLNKLEKLERRVEDMEGERKSVKESCENHLEKTEDNEDLVPENSETKIQIYRNLSSEDLENAIPWKTISESSSNESIAKFINALSNIESIKNIDIITEEKLMMLNSRDYEGRNFATAGENLEYNLNSHRRKQHDSTNTLSDINVSEQSDNVIEEILEMIADAVIFKSEKSEANKEEKPVNRIGDNSEGLSLYNSKNSLLKLDQEKLQRKLDIFSKLKTLDAFTKPLDISECNSEKNENEEDASPSTGRTVVYTGKSNTTKLAESFSKIENDFVKEKRSGSLEKLHGCSISKSCELRVQDFESNIAKAIKENLIVDKSDIAESDTIRETSHSENKSFTIKSIDESKSYFTVSRNTSINDTKPVSSLEIKENKLEEKNNCDSSTEQNFINSKCDIDPQNRKIISNNKKNQLSKSSITNFSTDTSESYFDVSNHDFAVSSIILTSENSNFITNNREHLTKSDTSSSYVDASDYCSKILSTASSTVGKTSSNLSTKENYFPESQILNGTTIKTEEIKSEERRIPATPNTTTKENTNELKEKSLRKIELIPKCVSSLPSNDKKLESIAKEASSISLNQESIKYSSESNIEKSNNKRRALSRSCIPILKSRVVVERREKSMENKIRSRSPVRRLHTPRIKSAESSCGMGGSSGTNENDRKVIKGSKKSLNTKQSYILPSKISDTKQESLTAKPDSEELREYKISQLVSSELSVTGEKSNFSTTSGQLTKECTVIYINIISDQDRNETQSIDAKELIRYVNENDLIPTDKKRDAKIQSLSLREIKSDRSNKKDYAIDVSSPASDSKLCKNLSEDVKTGTEKTEVSLEAIKKDSERISAPSGGRIKTANKLLSTSTLEIINSSKVEQKEIEVLAKPSVKNTSTSVSDFPDASFEEKRSFYNPKNEVFDVSKDLIQKEQILLSEMLTTNDPNFFECKKTHKLYNKLGLCFQDQTEQL